MVCTFHKDEKQQNLKNNSVVKCRELYAKEETMEQLMDEVRRT